MLVKVDGVFFFFDAEAVVLVERCGAIM